MCTGGAERARAYDECFTPLKGTEKPQGEESLCSLPTAHEMADGAHAGTHCPGRGELG